MKLYLIPQGMADGACLLYALLNCLKTLTNPELNIQDFFRKNRTQRKWEKLVAVAPVPSKLLNGDGVDTGLPVSLHVKTISNFVDLSFLIFSSPKQRFSVEQISLAQFKRKTDYTNSAIIFRIRPTATTNAYDRISHYLCAIGLQEQQLQLACSCAIYWLEPYEEHWNHEHKPYNNTLPIDQLTTKHIEHLLIFEVTNLRRTK
jgi:hypothetical protein